jgi:hypothetical protein
MNIMRRWRKMTEPGVLAAALIAALPLAGAEPSSFRSVKDLRQRLPDELDRPVRRETSSHRGWEIREAQFTVVANTSLEDARWAAVQVAQVREQTAALADRFTQTHRAADFGLNSLQVLIDGDPPRDRHGPATTIQVLGIQSQVTVNVSIGRPKLHDQILRLREAAALAMLHTAEVDAAVPGWVTTGLAAHLALQGQPADSPQPHQFPPRGESLGGDAWRWQRATQDRLASQPQNASDAAARVGFLLTGDDARHAPEFLTAIRNALVQSQERAATHLPAHRRGEGPQQVPQASFEQLLAANRAGFEAWLRDPQTGQPQYRPDPAASPEVRRAERDMLLVLKLARRLTNEKTGPAALKVVAFDKPQAQPIAPVSPRSEPLPIAELIARLRDPTLTTLATLDADGQLLLSTDREQIEQLLGWNDQRYQWQHTGDQWMLTTRLADGRTLFGALVDDPQNASRPVAQFSVAESGGPPARQPSQPSRSLPNARLNDR